MSRSGMKTILILALSLLIAAGVHIQSYAAAVTDQEVGDFKVTGDDQAFSFEDGVLTITGDVTVGMADGKSSTTQRIVVADNAAVTIDGVSVQAASGPAVKVNAGKKADLILKGTNSVKGADNYAGIEVGYRPGDLADLTIKGDGTLNAAAGKNSAAIGGSYNTYDADGHMIACYYGNITIESGTVNADATSSSGAGIGSAANNRKNYRGETMISASYKMETEAPMDWGRIVINGGTVTANGNGGQSAGIGGASHVDSGKVIINGGTINATGYTGIGAGLGSSKHNNSQKGPGDYYADVTINGGTVTAQGNDTGAGIGGAMYSDAIVTINGGDIKAYGAGRNGYPYGGAGIGGGYLGHANVTITGGTVLADAGSASAAAGIGSGGTPNSNEKRGDGGRSEAVNLKQTTVDISGGDVRAIGGGYGGAGIGAGTGADKVAVNISGGTVYAEGSRSNREEKRGGAGIGSGYFGDDPDAKYYVETNTDITITGGKVTAIGGWGASGIGSGADNKTADSIAIDAGAADIEAYSDGTKFAIDTRTIDDGTEDKDRDVSGDLMQGTFVFPYTSEDGVDQETEGLDTIQLVNDETQESTELTHMPAGYRSFARTVPGEGYYSVYTDSSQIAEGGGRFFNRCTDDTRTEEDVATGQDILERNVKYRVSGSALSDNFYLFPVKTVVVDKQIEADQSFASGIDTTLWFALWNDVEKKFVTKADGTVWLESIEVIDGVPQGTAAFGGIDEGTYGIWEVDPDDPEASIIGTTMEGPDGITITLTDVKTKHGDTEDNDATIDDDVWTDYVTVINYYTGEKQDDPDEENEDTPEDKNSSRNSDTSKDTNSSRKKTNTTGQTAKKTTGTKTGDRYESIGWLALAAAAAVMGGCTAARTRRRRRSEG